ncbi:MAG: type II secretion system protein GspE [Proteobacteria bacterium]|nr:MAG: type II secretion system protein GspE [Pseudomonadota bacterium]
MGGAVKDFAVSSDAQQALCKLLQKLGLISEVHFEAGINHTEHCPITALAKQGVLEEPKAIKSVAEKLQIKAAVFDRKQSTITLGLLDNFRLQEVSLQQWRDMRALPVELGDNFLVVAYANPLDPNSIRSLQMRLRLEIRPAIASEEKILNIVSKKLNASNVFDLDSILEQGSEELLKQRSQQPDAHFESKVEGEDVEAPPVVRLVNKILCEAVERGASDIHLHPENDGLNVKVRIDGILQPLFGVPAHLGKSTISRLKLLSGMNIAEHRKPQDGRLRIKTGFGVKDLRLSCAPTVHGENIVIRVLTSDLTRINFETLGFNSDQKGHIERALRGSSRVILSTGPTGSGKTSTLYACLLALCDGKNNIITIEDPIEYRIHGISQIQVNPKSGLSFAEGLRSILRQDPDIIMVGEIRDAETGSIAMQAAQTGHLVLSTLHTNTAAGAITRLQDLGVPAYLVASSVSTIVAQRLVRRLCPNCAESESEVRLADYSSLGLDPSVVKKAKGCEECSNTGFKGRSGIFSMLDITDELRVLIRKGCSEIEIEECAAQGGYRTLQQAGIEQLNDGITSIDELERVLGPLSAARMPTLQNGSHAPSPGISKRRLLLVEDEENTRMVLSLLFEREMFDVEQAADGLEAIEKIYSLPPEIIVCDLMMPRMNGIELIQKLRNDPRMRSIPVLMLTAANTENNELEAIGRGADDFVSKTSDSKVLVARVHRLLERS